jgi:hypothetical protein
MELSNTEGLRMTVLAGNQDAWLEEQLRPLIDSGKITFINTDQQPEALEQAGLKPEEVNGPLAIVSTGDDAQGEYCVISQIGESIIAHCEQKIIPLKDRA